MNSADERFSINFKLPGDPESNSAEGSPERTDQEKPEARLRRPEPQGKRESQTPGNSTSHGDGEIAPTAELGGKVSSEQERGPRRRSREIQNRHLKKKRSYTIDPRLCEDLDLLAWYETRSTSSIVEELIRRHLAQQRALVEKAKEIRKGRQEK